MVRIEDRVKSIDGEDRVKSRDENGQVTNLSRIINIFELNLVNDYPKLVGVILEEGIGRFFGGSSLDYICRRVSINNC